MERYSTRESFEGLRVATVSTLLYHGEILESIVAWGARRESKICSRIILLRE